MEKRVSVIVPAYNVKTYISECIESILRQSYQNLEIIIVDDGSTDGTWDVIQRYANIDPRIVAVSQENGGVSTARNKGLSIAKGEYCTFIDGDDYYEACAIETMVSQLERMDSDCVNCQYIFRYENGEEKEKTHFPIKTYQLIDDDKKIDFMVNELMIYNVGYEVWDKLYKMDIIQSNHLRFNPQCHIGEDLAFNIVYLWYAKSICNIETFTYNYRIREGSAMRKASNLDYSMTESGIMMYGVYNFFSDCGNEFLKKNFYLLFCRFMDNVCRGYNAKQVVEALKRSKQFEFQMEQITEIIKNKKDVEKLYPKETRKIIWRFYLYIRGKLADNSWTNKVYMLFYGIYRKLRGREKLQEWIVP